MTELTKADTLFMQEYNLEFRDIIGHGAFGVIFLVYSTQYKQEFAVKKIEKDRFAQAEVDFLIKLDSPHIVNLYGYYVFGTSVYLMMEYCPLSISNLLKNGKLTGDELHRVAGGICMSIKACHDQKISHADVKPSNFLLDKYGRVKVCDFGLSYECMDDEQRSHFVGSLPFMAPEIIKKNPYDPIKADIWSLGITLYALAAGRMPWKNGSREMILDQIRSGSLPAYGIKDRSFLEIIKKCLNPIPNQRATIDEILSMPFFKDYKPLVNREVRMSSSLSYVRGPFILKPKKSRALSIRNPCLPGSF